MKISQEKAQSILNAIHKNSNLNHAALILNQLDNTNNIFTEAIEQIDNSLENEKIMLGKKIAELENYSIQGNDSKLNKRRFQIDKLGVELSYIEEYLIAIYEMKIVFLYKTLEINIKQILLIAFGVKKLNNLTQESLEKAFEGSGILINSINGYKEIDELRFVNNAIKHYGGIKEDMKIKRVKEFEESTSITLDNLKAFYNRVEKPIIDFSERLIRSSAQIVKNRD